MRARVPLYLSVLLGVTSACTNDRNPSDIVEPSLQASSAIGSTYDIGRTSRALPAGHVVAAVRFHRPDDVLSLARVQRAPSDAEIAGLEADGAFVLYRFRNIPAALIQTSEPILGAVNERAGVRFARKSEATLAVTGDAIGWHQFTTGMRFPAPPQTYAGLDVDVVILDTGIDCSHQELGFWGLGGRCLETINFVGDGENAAEDNCCFSRGQTTSQGRTHCTSG